MKKTKLVLMTIIMIASFGTRAQVAINTDGSTHNASAMLDVKSADKGFLPPRVSNVNAISNPVGGLLVFDISSHCIRYYNGSKWSLCCGVSIDTDGDGVPDSVDADPNDPCVPTQLAGYTGYDAMNPIWASNVADCDGDGYTNIDEYNLGSDPYDYNSVPYKKNCLELYNAGNTTNGTYKIDSDGGGGNPPFDVICDMTTDGGGWTKIVTQDNPSIDYMNRFNPSSTNWQSGFNNTVTWNENNWGSSGGYVINFEYSDVKYSWVPGRYDNGGLGQCKAKGEDNGGNVTSFLSHVDAWSNNSEGHTITEGNTTVCFKSPVNYTSIRNGIITGSPKIKIIIINTDYNSYYYNASQIKELWVK